MGIILFYLAGCLVSYILILIYNFLISKSSVDEIDGSIFMFSWISAITNFIIILHQLAKKKR